MSGTWTSRASFSTDAPAAELMASRNVHVGPWSPGRDARRVRVDRSKTEEPEHEPRRNDRDDADGVPGARRVR